MTTADERIINRLERIAAAQGEGGAAFADITGEPTDNAALQAALAAKVPTSRTVNGQALSSDVVVTGRMLDTAGAPDNGIGANGDYAFDDATKTIYGPKAAGVWPAGVVLGAGAAPYLVYTALLTQTGTDAPVATVLQNTLGGLPVYGYSSEGVYTVTLADAFTADKTGIVCGSQRNNEPTRTTSFTAERTSATTIFLETKRFATGTVAFSDELLVNALFEIRVYP